MSPLGIGIIKLKTGLRPKKGEWYLIRRRN